MTTTSKPSSIRPPTIKLYRTALSGHCHRVELFLSLLGLTHDLVEIDLARREHKAPAFLAMNPFGQVPVLQDGEMTLADSNAILVYLQGRYAPDRWLPRDPVGAAQVQRWLSVAAGQLAYGAAASRVNALYARPTDPDAVARGQALFTLMEGTLGASNFLAGPEPTLADIANYAYVAHAPEGHVSLAPHPNIRAWLARIEALPRFVPMVKTAVGLAA